MKKIVCIDKEKNENEFYYYIEPKILLGMNGYLIKVFSIVNLNYGKFFTTEVYHVSDTEIKIKHICNNDHPPLIAKGISDTMIPELSNLFFKDIVSSSKNKSFQHFADEGRTEHADKYWQRLCDNGFAIYDKEKDMFQFKRFIPVPLNT